MNTPSLLREPDVRKRRARCKSKNYKDVALGLLTPPIKIGSRFAAWPEHEIDALLAAEVSGANEDEIRTLVKKLMAARADLPSQVREATHG